jgi:hypothetical protein
MAKVTLPLLGVEASGTIGDSVVFGRYKGINYARQHTVPANPRTAAQVAQRNFFKIFASLWRKLPGAAANAWDDAAKGTVLSGFNLFTRRNSVSLKGDSNLADLEITPGSADALRVTSINASYASGQVTVNATTEAPGGGRTIAAVHFVLLRDQAPTGQYAYEVQYASDTSSPYSATFTPASGNGLYRAYAFTQTVYNAKTFYSLAAATTVNVS